MRRGAALVAAALAVTVLSGCTSATPGRLTTPAPSGSSSASTDAAYRDPAQIRTLLADASRDLVDANSYDYRRLDAFLTTAEAATTGKYRSQVRTAFTTILRPQAPPTHAVQRAAVNAIGVSSLSGGTATVLAFLMLTITNASSAQPRVDPSTAVLSLQLVGGRWRISALTTLGSVATGGDLSCDPPGSRALKNACTAAGKGAELIATYSRAHFEADFARALAVTTGSLRTQVSTNRSTTLAALTSQQIDLTARCRAAAVQTVSAREVVVLVALDGYRSTAPTVPNAQMLRVTVVRSGARWLLSDVEAVAVR